MNEFEMAFFYNDFSSLRSLIEEVMSEMYEDTDTAQEN
jgi:hypothetical protein